MLHMEIEKATNKGLNISGPMKYDSRNVAHTNNLVNSTDIAI